MSAESRPGVQLEIGHVLFVDVVGYSKLLINQQRDLQERLTEIVRGTEAFRAAESSGRLIRLPVGDGMALVFLDSPEAPLRCAIEIQRALKNQPDMQLRMGINSGPINQIRDVNDRTNIAGAGINVAQRVMDCADAGHILVSKRTADDLAQSAQWQPHLHDLGQCEVKHDVKIDIFNFYDGEVGQAQPPQKFAGRATVRPFYRNWWIATGLIAAVLLALFVYKKRFAESGAHDKSIAVLPFVNMSADPQNAFFADGIQDDILTSLSKIKDLRVISRTSVMGYRGGKESHNLRDIGRTLGVTNLLEGSVRREGNRVVVTVQLLDAAKDRHLWANRYDRTLADSLGLQGELAAQIADELRVTLTADEKARVEVKPTENADAYVVYLQANQIERNPDTLLEDYKKAEQLYVNAIALDPKFALAHARLASTRAEIFHYYEPIDARRTQARSEAEIALQLQPNLGEAHLALGQCIYWIDQDYEGALREFETALRLAPNNTESGVLIAAIKRRQGKWQEALESYERISKLDPQNPNVVRTLLYTAAALRRWPESAELVARMRALAPASLVAKAQSGYVDFWWKGDTHLLKSILAGIPAGTDPDGVVTTCSWDVAMIERDYVTAKRVLDSSPLKEFSYTNSGLTPKSFFYGCIALAQGDAKTAQRFFESTRSVYEAAVKESPDSSDRHANLGLVYAFLGRKEDAIREGRRATQLKPESLDALDGALMSGYLALIYARCGEKDLAFPLLERLLKTPGAVDSGNYSVTVNDLKFRWEWDPIRNDPRFQKLLTATP
jgi:serine/threonine-protein kinase